MVVTVSDIVDHKIRPSRPWQRIVIEVKEGELLNGVKLYDDRKLYAFEVGKGSLELKYKSPQICEIVTETIKAYNSCDGDQNFKLGLTNEEQEIGVAEFEIVCAEGKIEFKEIMRWPEKPKLTCDYEDPVDTVSFALTPTQDPCVYKLNGSTSDTSIRKAHCKHLRGSRGCNLHEWWDEIERQTRIVGGSVNLKDEEILPLRPWIEHRRNQIRCDHLYVSCQGRESKRPGGCENQPG